MKKVFNNITLYNDINFNDEIIPTFMAMFDVEIINDKARVICNSPYVADNDNTSRLNKLSKIGSWCNAESSKYGYSLIVNGTKVFFRVEHNIYS